MEEYDVYKTERKAYVLNISERDLEVIKKAITPEGGWEEPSDNDMLYYEIQRAEAIANAFTTFYVNLYEMVPHIEHHPDGEPYTEHTRKCVDTYATTSLEYACDIANTLIDVYGGKPKDIAKTMRTINVDDIKKFKNWKRFGFDVWSDKATSTFTTTIAIEPAPGYSDNDHIIDAMEEEDDDD